MNYILLLLFLFLISEQSQAGVMLGQTRLIYNADKKEEPITIFNDQSYQQGRYLIQSYVDNSGPRGDQPTIDKPSFIVTPPLFILGANQNNTLRVIKVKDDFPQDRESVLWLNIKAIPADVKKSDSENMLHLSIKSRIKLFYRPEKLGEPKSNTFSIVKFKREDGKLKVENPTGYFLTFERLNIGSANINTDFTMVPPDGVAFFDLPSNAVNTKAKWNYVTDYGMPSEEQSSNIQ